MSKAEQGESPRHQAGGEKRTSHTDELEDYAGGYIQSRHGSIQPWLLAVYAILFVWALYYLYVYWGGLGPGLAN
jgi:hypothetical protein